MIQSMTGYGKATIELKKRKITVEIKSLNSKQMDLSVRLPNIYKEYEMSIRTLLTQELERGKVDFLLYVENVGEETTNRLNQNVVAAYVNQIRKSAQELGISEPQDWFSVLMRMPDVMKYEVQEADSEEWEGAKGAISEAIEQMKSFRKQEGDMLKNLFHDKIGNIGALLTEIEGYEAERIEKIKGRITESLQKIDSVDYDRNRLEQELIYYIEKLDVNEEKHRLANHLSYFKETMIDGTGQGKKLGFISQEIGREVNTLGSKSNHVEMQKIVVKMKDELEQIKEQVLNVL